MANLLLKEILDGKIAVEDIINWLTTDDVKKSRWDDINKFQFTQCEFILYYLNFLREQTKSIRQGSYNARQTPSEAIQPHVISDNVQCQIERSHRRASLFNVSENQIPTESRNNFVYHVAEVEEIQSSQSQIQTKSSVLSKQEISPICQINNDKLKKRLTPVAVSAVNKLQVVKVYKTTPEKSEKQRNLSDDFDISLNTTTSTPIVERNSSSKIDKTFNGFVQHGSNLGANIFPIDQNSPLCYQPEVSGFSHKEPESYIHNLKNLNNSNENFDSSNCLLASKNESVSYKGENSLKNDRKDCISIDSSPISDCSSNEWRNFSNSNASSKSKNLTTNESHLVNNFLLVNGTSEGTASSLPISNPVTPQNSKLYSRSVERSQNSKNRSQHDLDNTPKQVSHNVRRNAKTTPRQNASLGDFISIDTRGSKKNSAKKTNKKIVSSRSDNEETSINDRLSMTEESFPEIGKNCGRRKRRIKPTKLDVSDGINEKSTFGVISRPQIVNPQFLEALSTDKSDTKSFETERDLLRLERQKQQKNSLNTPVENNVPNILPKGSSVKKPLVQPLTPSLECVENREALDILARIYSRLLDFNLVLNPMTELDFVVSLLTLQYSLGNDKYQLNQHCLEQNRSAANPVCLDKSGNALTTECSGSFLDTDEKSEECVNLEFLNEELGCKVLTDDIVSTIDKNVSSKSDSEFNDHGTFENLTKSSLNSEDNNCTTENGDKVKPLNEEYFLTIHNCVYFATTFLDTQKALLSLLDRATLKLLCENNRIAKFSPDLQEYLNGCYKLKSSESSRLKHHYNAFSSTEANVSFQIDTDNRENFPSLLGFQTFKKQRDSFYELLRIWETKHLESQWQFSTALGGKVRALLTLHNDAANYYHFVRLFKSQLLLSCIGNGEQKDPLDDESFSFIKSLKHSDPTKLTRLQERLVTPFSSKGPVPAPSFPGVQEFYKEFILHAFNPMFHAHLQDCLVYEIMELNNTQFAGSEIEDTETMVDDETKQNFITCVSSLRLLAKVLGFVVSLPYRCDPSTLESIFATQLELRSQVLPPLNLQSCLQSALDNGKLSLTVPWMVKYLAMLDPVSLRLPYYRTVVEMLCYIYSESKHDSRLENPLSSQVVILLRFSIGWFFELCNFPERLYFNSRTSPLHRKLRSITNFDTKDPQTTLAVETGQITTMNKSGNSGPCIDILNIVDERTLYACCPFLGELKALLTADHSNSNNGTTIRHITPVSSGFENHLGSTGSERLQLQLEEAFFHGQPISTRKTVDFVAERVTSSCVKHICNFLLPRAREKNLIKFEDVASQHQRPSDINTFKSFMSTEMNSIARNLPSELKTQWESDILEMCESRTKKSIESLLAEDTLSSVKEMCSQIAIRMATERVNQWIQSHITGGSIFVKDMEMKINKIQKNKSSPGIQFEKRNHNTKAASPTDVIIELRAIIWKLLDNKGQSVTLEIVLQCLDNLYESLTERSDLLPSSEQVIGTLSVDFALFLAAHKTDIFLPEVHDKLIRIWKMECLSFLKKDAIFSRIFSPRNIMLLATPGNPNVWLPLGQLISKMLREEVLSIQAFSDQCTILLRYDWKPVEILKHISTCLTEVINDFKSTNEESEKMKLLLEWITETCDDIEFTFD